MKDFIRLPDSLFHDDPCFVPPLWIDETKGYTSSGNPILKNSEFILLILYDNTGKPAGRLIAYIDLKYNEYYRTRTGFFGAFECINDPPGAQLLITAAEEWLSSKGMLSVLGPINPVAENWGFVFEGYDHPPVYMSPWNPPYYHSFFTLRGYTKAKDLLVYEADIAGGYELPERYIDFREKFLKRFPGITLRRLDMKNLKSDARSIWQISNISLADNWGYVPLELPVMEDMLRKLKLIVDPDAVWMVEYKGTPVGFCLGFPDINVILKAINGRLFPFGWAKLLFGAGKLRDYRLFGLAVLPEWQGKGLDALMYINLYSFLASKKVRMEANYILEDNFRIRNSLEKLGMRRTKTYRIYSRDLQ